ncbi:hypothetical protein [Streptococcus oralis]|uniref:Uncharacterized protein n=1 Tax=Streptococcus oralis TaxID=1303 RepID=A0A139QYZ4_STROR|nr:hypothetical protein [Streptococcus oralis]KXU07726.1 hypothetical protein SORDD25_00906 [Streptococcus oralis]
MSLKKISSWIVKDKVILIFFFVSFLPILYAVVKIVLKTYFGIEDFGINLRKTIDFDWLAYYGSIIGSYLIVYTLKIENKKYREEKRDSVRPIWNVSIDYDSVQQLGNDSNNRSLSIYSKNKICVDYTISRYNYIKINKENTRECVSIAILIKIRNIGLGHALIDKIEYVEKNGSGGSHKLKAEERFMIDKKTSNNLLLHFDSKIEDIEKIRIFFIDILENKYVYNLKLEGTDDEKNFVSIEDKELCLFSLTKAYFESYFPDFVEKDS